MHYQQEVRSHREGQCDECDEQGVYADREEWEISLGHLVSSSAPFEGLLKVRGTYGISVVIGTTRKTGTAICTQAELSGSVGSLATGSVKFKGSGPLT